MPHVTSPSRSRATTPRRPDRGADRDPGAGLPTPFAESVLDLVEQIPPGRVMAYGDVAMVLGGGARAVGTVMARFGSGVPWHRVIRSDGSPPVGHGGGHGDDRRITRTHRSAAGEDAARDVALAPPCRAAAAP